MSSWTRVIAGDRPVNSTGWSDFRMNRCAASAMIASAIGDLVWGAVRYSFAPSLTESDEAEAGSRARAGTQGDELCHRGLSVSISIQKPIRADTTRQLDNRIS